MVTVIVLALYLSVVIWNFIPLVKKGDKKQSIVYGVFLSVSFCVLILHCYNIAVPGPSEAIRVVVEKLLLSLK